jgi:hypothetical protein
MPDAGAEPWHGWAQCSMGCMAGEHRWHTRVGAMRFCPSIIVCQQQPERRRGCFCRGCDGHHQFGQSVQVQEPKIWIVVCWVTSCAKLQTMPLGVCHCVTPAVTSFVVITPPLHAGRCCVLAVGLWGFARAWVAPPTPFSQSAVAYPPPPRQKQIDFPLVCLGLSFHSIPHLAN